jgi:hypothetical protein
LKLAKKGRHETIIIIINIIMMVGGVVDRMGAGGNNDDLKRKGCLQVVFKCSNHPNHPKRNWRIWDMPQPPFQHHCM